MTLRPFRKDTSCHFVPFLIDLRGPWKSCHNCMAEVGSLQLLLRPWSLMGTSVV